MTPVDPRAVEAAARAEYEHTEHDTWEQAHAYDKRDWLESARVALEAAQGIIRSDTWDECAQWHETYYVEHDAPPLFDTAAHANPYRDPQ